MSKKEFLVKAYGHTNAVIAGEQCAVEIRHVMCGDGIERDLWLCPYSLVAKLIETKSEGQLSFKVYCREGRNGKVKLWPFTKKKKLTLASAVKKGLVFQMPREKLNPVS